MPNLDERPATKHDLNQLEAHILEAMRNMQAWAKPAEVRLRSHEERLTLIETRVSEIELGKVCEMIPSRNQ